MLLASLSPVFLKCGVLLMNTKTLNEELESLKASFKYINPDMSIVYKTRKLLLFKVSYFSIEKFLDSPDYDFLCEKVKINKNGELNQDELDALAKHKDSITLINEPRSSSKLPPCYYCDYLTGKKEMIIYTVFRRRLVKAGELNHLTVLGIDYTTKHIPDAFYRLGKVSVQNLIKVGQLEIKPEKTFVDLKDNLYPYLVTMGQEGLSIFRVDSLNALRRLGGSTFGATTLWSLLTLTCGYEDPDAALRDAIRGNNSQIDLSVGDIYGGDYSNFGLDGSLIAASFGKLKYADGKKIEKKDIARSLVTVFAASFSQTSALLGEGERIDNVIILGNPFNCPEFRQMIQTCTEFFSGEKTHPIFSDFSEYFDIIGMCLALEEKGEIDFETDKEYSSLM